MVFDLLARRANRIVEYALVIDCQRKANLAHRKLMPYIKEWARGEASDVAPGMRAATYFVRANGVAAAILDLAKRAFMNAHQKRTLFMLSGNDPFAASPDFAVLFDQNALPADIGGTLTIGTNGHCCRGVGLPALNNADATWSYYYDGLLSSSLREQVAHRSIPGSAYYRASEHGKLRPDELEAARARHRDSPNEIACFISHDRQACTAEVGIVKLQLELFLDAIIFAGKCCAPRSITLPSVMQLQKHCLIMYSLPTHAQTPTSWTSTTSVSS